MSILGSVLVFFMFTQTDVVLPPSRSCLDEMVLCVVHDEQRQRLMWGGFSGLWIAEWPHGRPRHFTTRHGLPSNTVNDINVGPTGELFIGTEKGLAGISADLSRVETFSYSRDPRARVINVLENDGAGGLFIGTDHGLFFRKDGVIKPIYDSHEFGTRRVVDMAFSASSGLWVAKENVLSRYHEGRWHIYLQEVVNPDRSVGLVSNNLTAIAVDHRGMVWIGTTLGLNSYDGQTWKTYLQRDGLFHEGDALLSDYIWSLMAVKDGSLWVCHGNLGLGLSRFDGSAWSTFVPAKDIPTGYIFSMTAMPDGLCFATDKGLLFHDGLTWKFPAWMVDGKKRR